MAYGTSQDYYVAVRESVMKLEIKKEKGMRGLRAWPEFSWNFSIVLIAIYKVFSDNG